MDVINEIIQNSAAGQLSKVYKNLVLLLFSTIVSVLLVMLVMLFTYSPYMRIQFGY
ncbi:hypothetical protein [Maribacter polysaccharolyticus]|uniref:hypothetical protein n=1 Tax=Maribacter polysaccharolyticus TaxID=3020831 RepID=UPI00237F9507|nr:hypothetical protein [Maribacter polysaccharolyticus]MDE3740441.1 hypothetical protein [Maribacter polysaccharolyticus]